MPFGTKLARDLAFVALLAAAALAIGLGINSHRARPLSAEPSRQVPERLPPVPTSASAGNLSLAEFRAFVEEKRGVVLDARPETAYRNGHVPGALSLPPEAFEARYADLKSTLESDKTRPIMVYCSGHYCKSADSVQKQLAGLGYTRVSVFHRGWPAWQQAGLPEEKSE